MSSDASPTDLLDRAEDKGLAAIAIEGFGGFMLAIALSAIAGLQAVVEFLFLPFELFVTVGVQSIQSLILEPLGVTAAGVDATNAFLRSLDGLFGFFGAPLSVINVMIVIGIVGAVIALAFTSNVIPGTFVDNPVWDFFFGTPEEEADDEG